jgi:hypothetical protein
MDQEACIKLRSDSYSVNCFLEDDALGFILPQSGTTSLASFTDDNVSIFKLIFVNVFLLDENFLQIGQVNIEPMDIWISKVTTRDACVFCFIEHLAESMLSNFAKPHTRPTWDGLFLAKWSIHSIPSNSSNPSAIACSSAFNSAIISFGGRRAVSSRITFL